MDRKGDDDDDDDERRSRRMKKCKRWWCRGGDAIRYLRFDGTLINTEAIVDDVVVAVVTKLTSEFDRFQREIFDAAEDARGQRPLDASMELCEKLKLEGVVDPKTLGAVQRDAAMGGGRDGYDSRHARRDATAEIFETERCRWRYDVHEQRRTDEEDEE